MSLLSLPPEMTLLISTHLSSPKDLLSFLRTSQKLYYLLINKLYQNNIRSYSGSALVWYISRRAELRVQNIFYRGSDINIRSPNRAQSIALLEAVSTKYTSIIYILLENRALPDLADTRSRRSLVLATNGRSDVAMTKLLLEHGGMANSVAFQTRNPKWYCF
jgi:hypothetical protein